MSFRFGVIALDSSLSFGSKVAFIVNICAVSECSLNYHVMIGLLLECVSVYKLKSRIRNRD